MPMGHASILAALPVLPAQAGVWCVYLLLCENASLYCGIAKDPEARWQAHVAGRGARYTRIHKPLKMRLLCVRLTHGAALRCEYRIKRLSHVHKRVLWSCLPEQCF